MVLGGSTEATVDDPFPRSINFAGWEYKIKIIKLGTSQKIDPDVGSVSDESSDKCDKNTL